MTRVDWMRLLGGVVLGGGMAVAGVVQGQDSDRVKSQDRGKDFHARNSRSEDRSRLETNYRGDSKV